MTLLERSDADASLENHHGSDTADYGPRARSRARGDADFQDGSQPRRAGTGMSSPDGVEPADRFVRPSLATLARVICGTFRLGSGGERGSILFLGPELSFAMVWDSGPFRPRARDPAAGGASSRRLFEVQRQTVIGRCRSWETEVPQAMQALQPVINGAAVRSRGRA
jgi:hypothetical protein